MPALQALSREATSLLDRALAKIERLHRPDELRHIAAAFDRRTVLEIGGPSPIFGRALLSVYPRLAACDMVNYASRTLWDGEAQPRVPIRRQFVAEAVDLGVPDASYDGLLASHVLEHLANPLRALNEWQRVVAPGGPLLIVLPQRDRTFDHRRPVTPLSHVDEDFRRNVGEDDLTHLDEVLALHDARRDRRAGDRAAFAQRCRDNARQRGMHHHVFVAGSAIELLEHAGLAIEAVTARRPHHIVMLARTPVTGEAHR